MMMLAVSAFTVFASDGSEGTQGQGAAQQDTTKSADSSAFVKVSGSVTLTADFYNYSSTDSTRPGRRPPALYRLLISPTLSFGDLISRPFHIILTWPETNTITPRTISPTIAQFLENPANALGLSSFTPTIGWAKFHLGSHSPIYSPLSAGDQQIFGGGFDLTPGSFRIAASAGTSQRAIEPDTSINAAGSYRRTMYMGRLGFGSEDAALFGLNVVYATDDTNSLRNNISAIIPARNDSVVIPADTIRLRAEEGFVTSLDMKVQFTETMSFVAEGALSSFTRDVRAQEVVIDGNPLDFISTTRTSSRADIAASAAFNIREPIWGIRLSGLYMGAGFVPLGFTFMQSDRLEFSVAPSLRLFDNAFSINGSIGERINNLSRTKAETQRQVIGSVNLNADFSDEFNLSARYSNFGIRNDQRSDTLKLQTVSQSLSIDPTYTLQGETITHIVSAGFAIDDYKDYNVVSGAESSNDTRTLLASYSASFNEFPLTVNVLGSYMENRLSSGILFIRSIGTSIGYSFLERRLLSMFSVTASGSTFGSSPTDGQLFFKLGLRWKATTMIDVAANVGNNRYNYGSPLPSGGEFQELITQLSVSTRF